MTEPHKCAICWKDIEDSTSQMSFDGKELYFCSNDCLKQFEAYKSFLPEVKTHD